MAQEALNIKVKYKNQIGGTHEIATYKLELYRNDNNILYTLRGYDDASLSISTGGNSTHRYSLES